MGHAIGNWLTAACTIHITLTSEYIYKRRTKDNFVMILWRQFLLDHIVHQHVLFFNTYLDLITVFPTQVGIGSENGLVPNRRQIIIWISSGQFYRRTYASRGLDEFNNVRSNLHHQAIIECNAYTFLQVLIIQNEGCIKDKRQTPTKVPNLTFIFRLFGQTRR